MKIYTLTCHDVYNYGASLQAYALMKYLKSNTSAEVEIIDYKPEYLSRHYYLWNIKPKYKKNLITKVIYYCLKLPGRLAKRFSARKRNFDSFKKRYLTVTSKRYSSNAELGQLQDGDLYFAGSDQIWNPILENGNDSAFFLDFVKDKNKKFAYSASFSVEELTKEQENKMKVWLAEFNRISVRENSALDILSRMGIAGACCTVDPVFLLDKGEWGSVCSSKRFKEKYIFVYDFDKSQTIKNNVLEYARKNNLKIYSGLKSEYADKSFEDIGPLQFISLIRNAELVVSNSFHATAFSIIFHKSFYVFEREWAINTRMRDLIIFAGGGTENRIVKELPRAEEKINWEVTEKNMRSWIEKSKKYIAECLGESI